MHKIDEKDGLWPNIAVVGPDGLLEELELVGIKYDEMTSTEDGHENTQTAEEELVEGLAERPPRAQTQEHKEVDGWRQRGEHDTWRPEQRQI